MDKDSKGFILFSIFTIVLSAIVIILSFLVWQDPSHLQPTKVMDLNKEVIDPPYKLTEQEMIASSSEELSFDEEESPKEEASSEKISFNDLENFAKDIEEEEADSLFVVPSLMEGRAEDEIVKTFTGLSKLVTPSPPLEIIAPIPELQEKEGNSYLPKISEAGVEAWEVYKRPFILKNGDKISFIVYGLGLKKEETELAISKLPPEVTLSFSPYADNLEEQISKAREAGHETMIDLPLQSNDFPAIDGGPDTIVINSTPEENIAKLENILKDSGAFIGVIGINGEALFSRSDVLKPIYESLFSRGLLFLSTNPSLLLPSISEDHGGFISSDIFFSDNMFYPAIENNFNLLEKISRSQGHGLMVLAPTKILLDSINKWQEKNEQRGSHKFILVPVSALVEER